MTTPTVNSKHLDAIIHSITSTIHAMLSGADVIHYHALGPGLASPLPRCLGRARVVLTVHGLDNERAKWGGIAHKILGLAHWMSGRVPDQVVVVSKTLADHYRTTFGVNARYIPNGVAAPTSAELPSWLIEEYGLAPRGYVLFVGRLVPEKRPDLVIEAMRSMPADVKVAVVGGSSFTDEYVSSLRAAAASDERIVFPGYVHGTDLQALYSNAAVFVQPSDLEGLPSPSLRRFPTGFRSLPATSHPIWRSWASAPVAPTDSLRRVTPGALPTPLATSSMLVHGRTPPRVTRPNSSSGPITGRPRRTTSSRSTKL